MNTLKSAFGFILPLLCGMMFSACHAADAIASPKARYDAAEEILSACKDCLGINVPKSNLGALDDLWTAAQDLAVEYYNSHPHASPEHVDTGKSLALGPDLYAESAQYDEIGNVFLVGKRNGRYAVVWDIRHLPKQDTTRFPVLAGWSLEAARDTCREQTPDNLWDSCGPLHGYFGRLPPDASGQIRFYVAATFAQEGSTLGAQLSIWSWNGEAAKPLLAKDYSYMMEDVDNHFDGNVLHIREKEEYRTVFVTEPEVGRQMDWKIRITPEGIEDIGATPIAPEMDFVDLLLWKMMRGEPISTLISPKAERMVKQALAQAATEESQAAGKDAEVTAVKAMVQQWAEISANSQFPLGELWGHGVQRKGDTASVCFHADAVGPLLFKLKRNAGSYFVTQVSTVPETFALCRWP